MEALKERKCVPCEGGVAPLTRAQAEDLMQQLQPQWKLADDGKSIASEWKFRNFFHTMSFVNAVAPATMVAADRHSLLTILRNLIRNSAEHAAPAQCIVSYRAHQVEVEDDGPGIAPQDVAFVEAD